MTTVAERETSDRDDADERRSKPRPLSPFLLGTIGVAGFLAIWECVSRFGLVASEYIPPASTVIAALFGQMTTAVFWVSLGQTIAGWAVGLAIVIVVGVGLGLLIGRNQFLQRATASTIEFLRPIPSVALIPLAVLLYGISPMSTLILVLYSSFWPILIQTVHGAQDVDPVASDTASTFRFRPLTRLTKVIWPSALPYIMTGIRLSASVALILEITGELVIGTPGLGQQIALAQSGGAVDRLFAYILVTGFLGVSINFAVRASERRVLRWHASVRRDIVL